MINAHQRFCFPKSKISHDGLLGRRPITEQQKKIYNLDQVGWKPMQIAKRLKLPLVSVYDGLHKLRNNGWKR